MSDSLQPYGLYSPWNSPGENTGVGSLSLAQGIFPTQGLNPGLLYCRQILYWLSYKGSLSIKEINPEYSLERLMLKLKLQHFGHLMWRANTLEMTLILGKIERRRRGWQRMRWLDGIMDSMNMSLGKLPEIVKDWAAWHAAAHEVQRVKHDWATEQQQPLFTIFFILSSRKKDQN